MSTNAYTITHSQNFLKPAAAKRAVNLMQIDLPVVEIGPGHGALTQLLLEHGEVTAVELDHQLAQSLRQALPSLNLVEEDFLIFNLPQVPFIAVGNIPFALTSDILKKLLRNPKLQRAYLIMQQEAAARLIPGDKDNTLFGLQFAPWFEVKIVTRFSAQDFNPSPAVTAVMVEITRRPQPLITPKLQFKYLDFLAFCFTQTSGKLEKSLAKLFTNNQLYRMQKEQKLKFDVFPSQLTFHGWLQIFNTFETIVGADKQKIIYKMFAKLENEQSRLQKQHRTQQIFSNS